MSDIKHPKNITHAVQALINENTLKRSALGRNMKIGESVELSNGITFILKKRKGRYAVSVIILAPNDVRVYWDTSKKETEDEQT